MSLTIEQFQVKLSAAIKDIEENRAKDTEKIAADTLALVKRRVINTGKNSKGGLFGRYSRAVVPYFFYYAKETNRVVTSAVRDLYQRFGFFASYRDWRVVNNLPVKFINFSFTNRMWNSLFPTVEQSKGRAQILIKAKGQKEEDKLKFQNARFGDILAPSKEERELITKLNNDRLLKYFKKRGLI